MRPEAETLARYRLQRAREAFSEGELLLQHAALHGALNRYYYAGLYAARSLLATKNLDSSKHTGGVALFHEHFVRQNVVDTEVSRALQRALERRLKSDYGDFVTPAADAVTTVRNSISAFLEECERALTTLVQSTSSETGSE